MEYEYDITHEGKEYHCEIDCTVTVDGNYGADADGNRGTRATFIDVDRFQVWCEDESELKDEALLKQLQDKAEEKVMNEDE